MENQQDNLKNFSQLKQMMDPKNRPHILRSMLAMGNKEMFETLFDADQVDLQIDGPDYLAVSKTPLNFDLVRNLLWTQRHHPAALAERRVISKPTSECK